MNQPRVVVVLEYPTRSGGENSLLAILKHLSTNVTLKLLLPELSPLIPQLQNWGIDHQQYRFVDGATQANQLARLTALTALINAFKPAVIHGNSLSMGKFLGRYALHFKPAMITTHIRDIIRLSRNEINMLNQCNHLVCVSHATRQHLIEQGIIATKTSVIYNGIDTESKLNTADSVGSSLTINSSSNIRAELGLAAESKIALFIGQIGLRKGVDQLLEAVNLLKYEPEFKHWHLLIIGARFSQKTESLVYEQKLHAFTNINQLQDRLHFLGYREDIARIMLDSQLLIHPALQEPFGRVLLEAAISKLPMIATNVGGTQEIIEDGISGLLVAPGNPQALANAWKSMLVEPDLLQRLANAAYDKVAAHFTSTDSANALLKQWLSIDNEI